MRSVKAAPERTKKTSTPATEGVLFGAQGSAPTYCSELMLRHKGIPYRRVNLLSGTHPRRLRRKGFPGRTVPALSLDGQLVQTNREIARALDDLVPDHPLFPDDPIARAEVEAAEGFCDEELQPATRRMLIWSFNRDPDSIRFHPEIGKIPLPRQRFLRPPFARLVYRYYGVTEEVIREHFDSLPEMLDRVDGYIDAGVLNGPDLNAADFQVAPMIVVLLGICDLGGELGGRPAAALADRVAPE
jgi:glutathione S-transferase